MGIPYKDIKGPSQFNSFFCPPEDEPTEEELAAMKDNFDVPDKDFELDEALCWGGMDK